jgi:hypothetical protein
MRRDVPRKRVPEAADLKKIAAMIQRHRAA